MWLHYINNERRGKAEKSPHSLPSLPSLPLPLYSLFSLPSPFSLPLYSLFSLNLYSAGNGAAMRVAPLAIWAYHGGKMKEEERLKNLANLVVDASTITHHDVLGTNRWREKIK